jgi:type IV pilus assembly protein PilB
MAAQRKLGEILVEAGVIDQFQLRSALGEQQRWGGRLGITLIKLGFLDERDLVRALAGQLDLPVARLEGKRIQQEVLDLVPLEVAEQAMCLPLFVRDDAAGQRTLYLGMEDPCDLQVMDELRFRTGLVVKPVLMGPSEICEGIDRFYHRRNAGSDALELTEPPAPARLAREHRAPPVETPTPGPRSVAPAAPVPETPTLPTPESSPGIWMAAVLDLLVEKGVASRSELEARVVAHLGLSPPSPAPANDADPS